MSDPQSPNGMISAVEIVTPEIAVQMLDMNHHNRPVRKSAVKQLAGIIRRGEWSLSHQGIAFDQSGRLLDGQHRLMAIVETGISCELLVTRNAPTSSFQVMDQGVRRSMADVAGADKRVTETCSFAAILAYGAKPTFAQIEPILASRIGQKVAELIDFCGTTRRYHTSAPMKLVCAISALKSRDDHDFAFAAYRSLAILDFDNMPVSAKALVRQEQSGKAGGAKNRGDTLARALVVFDRSKADITKIQISESAADDATQFVRAKIRAEISNHG